MARANRQALTEKRAAEAEKLPTSAIIPDYAVSGSIIRVAPVGDPSHKRNELPTARLLAGETRQLVVTIDVSL